MTSHPLQPSNLPQLQPPHMPLMPHPHLPRPPHQLQQVNMPGLPSSMPGSGSIQAMPIPGPMGIQGNMNQMVPPMPQGHC
uniref:Flowering time control protein FY-like n=1 Tax=Nicotiana tabacum TaxID=4097 RepID=A0A1S4C2H0_TOBAC|nr:PREDICTED: flowering time control protein FY-like [Nicotiana tabacum]